MMMNEPEAETPSKEENIDLPNIPEWPEKEKLAREKAVLGFYRSGHPLKEFRKDLAYHCTHNTASAKQLPHRTQVVLGGIVSQLDKRATKTKNELYARFELEDEEGTIPCVLWPSSYAKYGAFLSPDAVVLCVGSIDNKKQEEEAKAAQAVAKKAAQKPAKPVKPVVEIEDDDDDDDEEDFGDDDSGSGGDDDSSENTSRVSSVSFLIDKVVTIESLRKDYSDGLRLRIFEDVHTPQTLQSIKEILRSSPGKEKLEFVLCTKKQKILLECDFSLRVTDEILNRMKSILGEENVAQLIRKITPEPRHTRWQN